MNTYTFTVYLKAKVQAYNAEDAVECVGDVFGPGSTAGVEVIDFEAVDVSELG